MIALTAVTNMKKLTYQIARYTKGKHQHQKIISKNVTYKEFLIIHKQNSNISMDKWAKNMDQQVTKELL